jgi:hypothetical protein
MKKSYSQLQSAVSLDGLILEARKWFGGIKDIRSSNCSYTLPDLLMSVFAMFSLKYASLLDFETQTETERENLRTLYGVETLSSDACLRKVLDKVDWQELRAIFKGYFLRLKSLGIARSYQCLGGYTVVSVDGVEHFSSQKVHCPCCLSKTHKDGRTTYWHSMLCAVMVHPQEKEVFVLGTEPIQCQDGQEKNDCERSASKRLISWLAENYKGEKFLLVEDALYSTAPNIQQIRENGWEFLLAVKPDGHKHLFRLFEARKRNGKLLTSYSCQADGCHYRLSFFNNVGINEANPDVRVSFLHCIQTDEKGKETTFTWVSSIPITTRNVVELMKVARSRWKIENETFNTLKNQGYRFEHNYGHGHQQLSSVFAHLMLLAFLTDQIVQRCSHPFKALLKAAKTKLKLWQLIRACFQVKSYNNFKEIYEHLALLFKVKLE